MIDSTRFTLAMLFASLALGCGARTELESEERTPRQVDCLGEPCAPGEVCCVDSCDVETFEISAHCAPADDPACAVADFTRPLPNGSDCDEPSDCPGQQCCSFPFTFVTATGLCGSWTTTCSDSCEGESAIGVSAGTACIDASDCGPGLSCCDCDGYLYPICQVECGWPGTLDFTPVCDVLWITH